MIFTEAACRRVMWEGTYGRALPVLILFRCSGKSAAAGSMPVPVRNRKVDGLLSRQWIGQGCVCTALSSSDAWSVAGPFVLLDRRSFPQKLSHVQQQNPLGSSRRLTISTWLLVQFHWIGSSIDASLISNFGLPAYKCQSIVRLPHSLAENPECIRMPFNPHFL